MIYNAVYTTAVNSNKETKYPISTLEGTKDIFSGFSSTSGISDGVPSKRFQQRMQTTEIPKVINSERV